MQQYYRLYSMLGTDAEERALVHSITDLRRAHMEPLVQFLHTTFTNLATLIVRPTVNAESGEHHR